MTVKSGYGNTRLKHLLEIVVAKGWRTSADPRFMRRPDYSLPGSMIDNMVSHARYPVSADEMHCRLAFCVTVDQLEPDSRPLLTPDFLTGMITQAIDDTWWMRGDQWPLLRTLYMITALAIDLQSRNGEPHPYHRPPIPCPTPDRFRICK